ncbi:Chemotaxis response regulator protein-glutamate methylesterase [Gemmata obscuriglobus]|uniref:Protein-glutamate methylesterase/protein-glutamine glutaminase n=1 Tax=Gemmata obscuriglobus TaxID=114 RepID=A0A2Z3GQ33_9BACT|nr:chemotaxis response regulator protein-glutamate methylesterase [Gemmata obscuriglobus]AWM36399.1 chemotaxis response regulator protein-glutamate methylesterase [Gemmata obscuriglobus]QEG30986.1 Chemotaxis response regulator protein-glutamate methylesterase [Gemmata obscuriglobus]VTS10321.1 chemotaxis protein : Chemotaxis response regulator protein-glutamate methylesterase OS=Desulfovibrio gigas DSM 1382 = ATCC 19364 GN=cheB PE=3 SV=1: Response_reg: CheB_methylest [Gemmata obscuriglobus UQM 22
MPLPRATRPIRVVLADDSALMRKKLREILESDPALEVVASARDGAAAVDAVRAFDPDVVTLDINMPVMDGVTALQTIMNELPRPVLMISSLTQEGALATYECLELGAVDVVPKLGGTISAEIERQSREIIAKVKAAAGARVRRSGAKRLAPQPPPPKPAPAPPARAGGAGAHADRVVAIGVSTGGPKTLQEVVPLLPPDLPAAVVIVQHMPETFTASFARSLGRNSQMPVKEAEAGDTLRNGHVYVARGGKHLIFADRRPANGVMVRYVSQPADALHIPSVDVMMHSAVDVFRSQVVGVLLTGMGSDGADGMVAIRRAGGETIAEDESTCVVFGMPAVAAAKGGAAHVLPCHEVAAKVVSLLRRSR